MSTMNIGPLVIDTTRKQLRGKPLAYKLKQAASLLWQSSARYLTYTSLMYQTGFDASGKPIVKRVDATREMAVLGMVRKYS